jgi:hypothetical protein
MREDSGSWIRDRLQLRFGAQDYFEGKCLRFFVLGLGFRVQGLVFRIWDYGFKI